MRPDFGSRNHLITIEMTEETTNNELQVVIDQNGLEQETRIALKNAFDPFYNQAKEWEEKALALNVTREDQIQEMTDAREARLALKGIRVSVEKKRKELKEDSLRKGKAIDSIAGVLKDLIEPIETHLELQEKFVEIQEEKRKTELRIKRTNELLQFKWEGISLVNPDFYSLDEMDEDQYQAVLGATEYALKKKKEDQEKAEADRKAAAEAAETKRIADDAARKKLEEENKKLRSQVREVKTELKNTTEVLKETKTELTQEKVAFTGFATGLTSAAPKTEYEQRNERINEKFSADDEKQDVDKVLKLIADIRAIAIPDMNTPKGSSLGLSIKVLLKKVTDYAEGHIKPATGKIGF